MNATLVSVHSNEENDFIKKNLIAGNKPFWLGAISVVQYLNVFAWLDATEFNYQNWHNGEPNDLSNSCVGIAIVNGKWKDELCEKRFAFICQKILNEKPFLLQSFPNPLLNAFKSLNQNINSLTVYLKRVEERIAKIEENLGINNEKSDCGIREVNEVDRRIVGGSPALQDEFPWQVGIEFDEAIRGGGVILNKRWILTAAHIFLGQVDFNSSHYRGIVGAVSINEAPIYVFFDKLIVHDKYERAYGKYNNDIALLHTTKDLRLYPKWRFLNSICLPNPRTEFDGRVSVSGWGNVNDEGVPAKRLMAVDLNILNDKVCEAKYKNVYNKIEMICAGYPLGGKDSCLGDSGSPLIQIINEVGYLVGIVSFGPPDRSCGEKDSAAVYTRVTHYVDWIKSKIK
ncbi:coagulation factor XI-like isoform X3 [Dinothrombium tinctorium]|uniref:Coagulation factor XI-like isoform X3 n=1 Tax=Dinothrombium tinctorium TaxID=1965070 RepID=A0A443QML1_9ACAR|nr:coagulation factor XI-like isoform X3 [Dinothrombium tinctorium]